MSDSERPADDVAIRLPGWGWALCVYVLLWFALAPYHRHVTISVETDFPGYARLAGEPVTWDPFVPVGFPQLLDGVSDVVDDTFRAGVALSFLGGAWLLIVAHALARRALPPRAAAYATTLLAVNWIFLQNGLLAGTDALWTAAILTSFHLLLLGREQRSRDLHGAAGLVLGLSFLLRYATLGVAPWMLLATLIGPRDVPWRERMSRAGLFVFAAALGALPQMWIATRDAGNPLASGQAANVWFGMFGNRDWPRNWTEIPADVSLTRILADHPGEFVTNLLGNAGSAVVQAFTSLLGLAPAGVVRKWEMGIVGLVLAAAAVGAAGAAGVVTRVREVVASARRSDGFRVAALCAVGYAASVSAAFWMTRFFLPVLVLAVIAAAVCAHRALWTALAGRAALRTGLLLAAPVLLAAHSIDAWATLLRTCQQPIEEVGTALAAAGIRAPDVIASTVVGHYEDVLPFQFEEVPLAVEDFEDLQLALARLDAAFFLHEERLGPGGSYHPELDRLFDEPDLCPFLDPIWMKRDFPRAVLFRAR